MCQMSQVLKSDTAHISQTKLCLPLVISWLIAGWKEVLPALLTHIEISTFHVTQSLKCHMSQVLKKVEQSKEELDSLVPPSAQLAAGWLTADWGGSQGLAAAWLSAGEAFPPSSSSSHFPDYFHTFPRRKSAISPRFLFKSGPSPFSTSSFSICKSVCHSFLRPILCPMCLPIIVWASNLWPGQLATLSGNRVTNKPLLK